MVHGAEDIGVHYAATLRRWRERFLARTATRCARLGYDERFVRTWEFYLAFCEAAFRTRAIHDSQLVLTRPSTSGCRRWAAPESLGGSRRALAVMLLLWACSGGRGTRPRSTPAGPLARPVRRALRGARRRRDRARLVIAIPVALESARLGIACSSPGVGDGRTRATTSCARAGGRAGASS